MVEFAMPSTSKKYIPDIKTQKSETEELLSQPMAVGQTWYLIDAKWYKTFKYFVGLENPERSCSAVNPGPIDNSLLLDSTFTNIKKDLVECLDYAAVPEALWTALVEWYGIKENQPPIPRKVINVARPPSVQMKLEVYQVDLNLYNNADFLNPVTYPFSKADKISRLEEICRQVFRISDQVCIHLRCYYGPNQTQVLNSESTVYEESLDDNLKIVVEMVDVVDKQQRSKFMKPALPKNRDPSKIPRAVPISNRYVPWIDNRPLPRISHQYDSISTLETCEGRGSPCIPGLSGLMNLGNTCFMNSIIQCLSNCRPITQYFLNCQHLQELNSTNPLGKAGKIAISFADVIRMIWSGKCLTTVPHYFKIQLTKFAPQFAGCQQHDAQELLTFLLDGLHEDLNRIKVKPYFLEEDNEQDDETLAQLSWEYFLRRNDSIIIDNFHGMLKSRVVCPDCEKVSIKFDTFSTLSLPLPLRCNQTMKIRFVPYDQTQPVRDLLIKVPTKGVVRDIVKELSRVTDISPDKMVIAEVNKCHFHHFFSLDDPIEAIDDWDKLHMYDIPKKNSGDDSAKYTILPVVLWDVSDPARNSHFLNNLFGTPFLLQLPRGVMVFKKLYDTLCFQLNRSCPAFMEANTSYGCFSMDVEPADEGDSMKYQFKPVMVNTFSYDSVKVLKNDEHDEFVVPDNFGRSVMALQVQHCVRMKLFKNLEPHYEDHTHLYNPTIPQPTLDDCLNLFTSSEKLGESNAWHCPRCNQMKRATKKLDLWKLPNILIFHLKRFAFNEIRREKLDCRVEFPLDELNMGSYVLSKHKENLVYELIGVCNHYGSLFGGHYTAFCKNFKDNKWYSFDDHTVTPVDRDSIQTEHAYVLFYQRRPSGRAYIDNKNPPVSSTCTI